MLSVVALTVALCAFDDVSAETRAAYRAERSATGRDAASQVRLALWCERHALSDERVEHLARAVLADPGNLIARALLGQVRDGDTWVPADQLAAKISEDTKQATALAEYNARREKVVATPAAHCELAQWCENNGLSAEAMAHWTTVVRLDPSRADAWAKLGCKKFKGRWLTKDQIEAEQAEAKAQQRANREWMPRLVELAEQIQKGRDVAATDAAIEDVTDPRAVPAIWRLFALKGEARQRIAVRLLSQIDSVGSSQALAAISVFGASADVRRIAAENLRQRDRREYLTQLIFQVCKPLRYELRPNPATNSMELFVEGVKYDVHRSYRYPAVSGDPRRFFDPYFVPMRGAVQNQVIRGLSQRALGGLVPIDPALQATIEQAAADPAQAEDLLAAARQRQALGGFGADAVAGRMVGVMGFGNLMVAGEGASSSDEQVLRAREARVAQNISTFQAAVAETEARIQQDCVQIDVLNAAYEEQNRRVLPVLNALTGEDYGAEPEGWARWWTEEQGYAYQSSPKPVVAEVVAAVEPIVSANAMGSSCFAAGTLVHTRGGLKAIETLMVGDQVLSQDVRSGSLQFEPVIAAWHNRPDELFRVRFGDDMVLATGIHRFWQPERGWVMVRDMKPGDLVRTRNGIVSVGSIESAGIEPVFNLDVPVGHSFFVGRTGALVHDYSLIETVDQPFDRLQAGKQADTRAE